MPSVQTIQMKLSSQPFQYVTVPLALRLIFDSLEQAVKTCSIHFKSLQAQPAPGG